MGFNVAELLARTVQDNPEGRALVYRERGSYRFQSFQELGRRTEVLAGGLRRAGLVAGERVLMMVPQSPEFVALTFGVFKVGALPVLIDPGMGLPGLLRCVARVKPQALIAIRPVHALRRLYRGPFATVRMAVSVDGAFPGALSLSTLTSDPGPQFTEDTDPDAPAAILFTSGSTGPAKGVVYRHSIFRAQVAQLRDYFGFRPGEVDLPGFPLFALFSTALGLTCVLPELNPSRPGRCDPQNIVRAIQECQVNNLQGSPAIWTRVGAYCREHFIRLPSLKRLLTFGAPIQPELLRTWTDIMPGSADLYTPYGATEALPVSCITGREVLAETAARSAAGEGTCVGQPLPGISVEILDIRDEPVPEWRPELVLGPQEPGEVVVSGEVVTWEYDGLPQETGRAKIRQGERIWHRMGDMGWRDRQGRLWLLGRKSHRVEGRCQRYFPDGAEGIANRHPRVARTALVGVGPAGQQEPVLVVEPADASALARSRELTPEILAMLGEHPLYRDIRRVLYHRSFPVDPRHNAKIHREELAAWAAGRR